MKKIKKCVFAGSFDPFTNGHLMIVKKAAGIFDEVHVLISVNSKKVRTYSSIGMKDAMIKTFEREKLHNVTVTVYNDLVVKYCDEHDIKYYVRGIRNSIDFNYEENIKLVNKEVAKNLNMQELETIYFTASSDSESVISSTTVKEYLEYGIDVRDYVPRHVADIICK